MEACTTGPPQIVDYSPARDSQAVPTTGEVSITFDRAMDRASVDSRLHLNPPVTARTRWNGDRQVFLTHDRLRTDSEYRVVLDAGYRDASGYPSGLTHNWRFHTEGAPVVTGFLPGPDSPIDPGAYLSVTFNRAMDPGSVAAALTLTPSIPLATRTDPADPRRILIAPAAFLDPLRTYLISVSDAAVDTDGNNLATGSSATFAVGPVKPLHGTLGFIAQSVGGPASAGLWIVDRNRFPRPVAPGPVAAFTWALDGLSVLLRAPDGSWSELPIGGAAVSLPFRGFWAAALGGGRGYVFLDGGRLGRATAGGEMATLATGVSQATLSPDGDRVAFAVESGGLTAIRGISLDIRTQYALTSEAGTVTDMSWSPDGTRLAYLVDSNSAGGPLLRTFSLNPGGGAVTVAAGPILDPAWQADSAHLVVAMVVATQRGSQTRAFSVPALTASIQPPIGQALPPAFDGQVSSPQPSPDGHQVAFLGDSASGGEAWIMNQDGTGLARLTHFDPIGFPYSCLAPLWTPT